MPHIKYHGFATCTASRRPEIHQLATHVIIVTLGSAGDLFPFLKIATELARCGHRVTLVAPTLFAQYARAAGTGTNVAALVHHGCLGMLANALRAGLPPSVASPFPGQFNNAAREPGLVAGLTLLVDAARKKSLWISYLGCLTALPFGPAAMPFASTYQEQTTLSARSRRYIF